MLGVASMTMPSVPGEASATSYTGNTYPGPLKSDFTESSTPSIPNTVTNRWIKNTRKIEGNGTRRDLTEESATGLRIEDRKSTRGTKKE
jgi:hypothetical protein